MLIDLKAIPREEARHYEFNLDRNWWRPDDQNDQILGLDRPLNVKVKVYRAGKRYVIEGSLSGILTVACDRCLNSFKRDLKFDFSVLLAAPPPDLEKVEIELLEDDMNIDFIRDEEIDMDAIIKEQLYLSLPIKSLCREDCAGLCPDCGNNLNNGDCRCNRMQMHSGFSKLKDLKIE